MDFVKNVLIEIKRSNIFNVYRYKRLLDYTWSCYTVLLVGRALFIIGVNDSYIAGVIHSEIDWSSEGRSSWLHIVDIKIYT